MAMRPLGIEARAEPLGELMHADWSRQTKPRPLEGAVPGEEFDELERPMPVCPNPSVIPKLDLKKGTTTLGFQYKGGIIVAVDSRASTGQYAASGTTQKVMEINEQLLGTMAGGAADCQYWHRVLGMECRLWELRNKEKITVAAASKILVNIFYNYRNMGLSAGTMVAGWDKLGPALYCVDDSGSRVKGTCFSIGSGSIYAYGVIDGGYKHDMTDEEAQDLGRRAILHATHRDAGSGGYIQVYHIHKALPDGRSWTKISREDCMDIYDRYQEDGSMAKVNVMDP